MARRKQRTQSSFIGIAILAIAGLVLWYGVTHLGWHVRGLQSAPTAVEQPPAPPIDPASEGKKISVSGKLVAPSTTHDPELGISTDAVILVRNVEMYQWRETCAGNDCKYDEIWSAQPIDSSKFHTPAGHENPRFPFTAARYGSGPVRVAGMIIDPQIVNEQVTLVDHPVHTTDLPANLAATFRDADGALVSDDAAHPKAGTVRVSYRATPTTPVTVSGVQHGHRLDAN